MKCTETTEVILTPCRKIPTDTFKFWFSQPTEHHPELSIVSDACGNVGTDRLTDINHTQSNVSTETSQGFVGFILNCDVVSEVLHDQQRSIVNSILLTPVLELEDLFEILWTSVDGLPLIVHLFE